MRRVAIITGTRAEWGLLSPIAKELSSRDDVEVKIIATNMHLSDKYGHTIDEIISDGFTVDAKVPMDSESDTPHGKVKAMAECLSGMADAIKALAPDLIVILGDRYEMLAAASAAMMMRVPIAHIAGGEISEGAIDDSIRHAITKMAALHLTATEEYRRRVIQLGEQPATVLNTGSIGVYNMLHVPVMSREELSESVGMEIDGSTLLVTYHPATLDTADVGERCEQLLKALDAFPECKVLFTYPNNDASGRVIIEMIEKYAASQPARVKVIPSLGKTRYISALHYVGAVVGNSSSGIVEVPTLKVPVVNIGIRQKGRLAALSVIHCGDSVEEIKKSISLAISPRGKELAEAAENPYYKPDTLASIVDAIATYPLESLRIKKFHDLDS